MKKILIVLLTVAVMCTCLMGFASCKKKNARPDDVIYIRNLYFGTWTDYNDDYTKYIENKFGVRFTDSSSGIKPQSYDFSSWDTQVNNDYNGDTPDLFQVNIDSYNFYFNYVRPADAGTIKALPNEVLNTNGRWKNIARMLNGLDDINYLKYEGKLYGIPLARNIEASDVPFSPFTYVYRRDVAQRLGVYQENDEYTWEQFEAVLRAFDNCTEFKNYGALGDSEWGFSSILNFYKTASHAYAVKNGQVVCNYTTDEFLTGMNQVREWSEYYLTRQLSYALQQNKVKEEYTSGHIGILYENLSMSNYLKLWQDMNSNYDKVAIMKVKGPDGKYALEEQEQWFSMSVFSGNVSDAKMEKILDIMDWLLSEEGTMMALYGIKDQDYKVVNGEVQLIESSGSLWKKGRDGKYTASASNNGARYLRYIVTLGNDLNSRDPLIQEMESEKAIYDILKDWTNEMMEAYNDPRHLLKVIGEDRTVKWMATENKNDYSAELLEEANSAVINYAFDKNIKNEADFKKRFDTYEWRTVVDEINRNR